MTQEDRNLLIRDVCARIPYGVKASTKVGGNIKISFIGDDTIIGEDGDSYDISFIKPYLFPFSSLTEEQKKDLLLTTVGKEGLKLFNITKDGIISKDKTEQALEKFSFNWINFSNKNIEAYINWCNKNYLDWRGLIPMGLAIDATNLNIY